VCSSDLDLFIEILDVCMPNPKISNPNTRSRACGYEHNCHTFSPVYDFILYRADLSGDVVLADLNIPGASIVLCTAGEIAISNSIEERLVLQRGEAAYLGADAKKFSLAGSGTAFMATSSLN
jgi:mannose-6-phosphate isomerase class I